jgi:hypothetical protein
MAVCFTCCRSVFAAIETRLLRQRRNASSNLWVTAWSRLRREINVRLERTFLSFGASVRMSATGPRAALPPREARSGRCSRSCSLDRTMYSGIPLLSPERVQLRISKTAAAKLRRFSRWPVPPKQTGFADRFTGLASGHQAERAISPSSRRTSFCRCA